jgi:hypothetical protein
LTTQQELLDQLGNDATQFYAMHQRYITDAWGTFQFTGETYRQKGEKQWTEAQAALAELKQQACAPIPLLQRTSLTTFMDAMQGMQIRLSQRFAETPDDPSIQEDKAHAHQLWQALNRADQLLYQQLG